MDIEKAFDIVNWSVIFKILKRLGIDYTKRRLFYKLCQNEMIVIRIGEIEKKECIRKRLKEGCTLTLSIFNSYIQKMIDITREKMHLGLYPAL